MTSLPSQDVAMDKLMNAKLSEQMLKQMADSDKLTTQRSELYDKLMREIRSEKSFEHKVKLYELLIKLVR